MGGIHEPFKGLKISQSLYFADLFTMKKKKRIKKDTLKYIYPPIYLLIKYRIHCHLELITPEGPLQKLPFHSVRTQVSWHSEGQLGGSKAGTPWLGTAPTLALDLAVAVWSLSLSWDQLLKCGMKMDCCSLVTAY